MQKTSKPAVGMVSLGCPKNLVDSEVMLGDLADGSFPITGDPSQAEVVIVNTCSFIEAARQESIDAIKQIAELKKSGQLKGLVVTGCMAQRYGDLLREQVPEIDAIVGMSNYAHLKETVAQLEARPSTRVDGRCERPKDEGLRLRLTAPHTAYLRLSEGCDNPCTFCAIPGFRGSFRSKQPEQVLAEARSLVADGAVELNLISQDLTSYGKDLDDWNLARLLQGFRAIDELRWVRLLYAYPAFVSDALLDELASNPKLVKYLDMPIQHISQRMLRRMGRLYKGLDHRALLERIREKVPGIALRTTFIVGFPGETDADFAELLDFVKSFRFERLGVFTYSTEEGTPAGQRFKDDIPEELKLERQKLVMEAQQSIAWEYQESLVGQELDVLIDSAGADGVRGRTAMDAPDIDGLVWMAGEGPFPVGELLRCRILAAQGYDLVAERLPADASSTASPVERQAADPDGEYP